MPPEPAHVIGKQFRASFWCFSAEMSGGGGCLRELLEASGELFEVMDFQLILDLAVGEMPNNR